jgi:hypothetical protein
MSPQINFVIATERRTDMGLRRRPAAQPLACCG